MALSVVCFVALLGGCTGSKTATMADLVNVNGYSWYEYRSSNTPIQDMDGNVYSNIHYVYEFNNTTFDNAAARHVKITQSYGNITYVRNYYLNTVGDTLLDGGWARIVDNKTVREQNYSSQQISYIADANLYFGTFWNDTLTKSGVESLTVNGKSYNCDVYKVKRDNHEYSFWFDPKVPVPLKMHVFDTDETYELVDWGQ
ncbi:MAG: hypothetical protein WBZ29_15625 [Methanocella sp.]